MDGDVTEHQTKERLRTRWTASLDKVFADLVVEQIQLGNRPNNIFDKKSWGYIRDEFNTRTALNFNNNQLRKHLDVLRTRYTQVKSTLVQNDFIMDDSCCIGLDLWEGIGVNPRPEPAKIKDCPIYEQLCIIFGDNGADGRYAQSSHYEEMDQKPIGITATASVLVTGHETETPTPEVPSSLKSVEANVTSAEKGVKNILENKRKRPSETYQRVQHQRDQAILDSMAEALLDMIAASKLRTFSKTATVEKFSITNCIKALDEIEGLGELLYFAALDLFDDPNFRETFISLASTHRRLQWLQGKFSSARILQV